MSTVTLSGKGVPNLSSNMQSPPAFCVEINVVIDVENEKSVSTTEVP